MLPPGQGQAKGRRARRAKNDRNEGAEPKVSVTGIPGTNLRPFGEAVTFINNRRMDFWENFTATNINK